MKDKDEKEFFDLNNVEIEYNEDFDSNKTKSLTKFPNKNIEFDLDDGSNNFSKSLNFNSHKCFAPKVKFKPCLKKPSPIFFKKVNAKFHANNEIISEELLSEKESSLMDESSSSDYIVDNTENDKEDEINDNKLKNNIAKNPIMKPIDELIDIYKKDIKPQKENNIKLYEHKSIGTFLSQRNIDCKCKNLIKNFRNNLYRTKLKYARIKNKEQEYKLKDSNFKKFGLDLVIVNKKSNNDYTIIPINDNDNSNSDEDPDDMDNLRGTISYNKSKTGDIKESKKRVNIFDVLRKSCK